MFRKRDGSVVDSQILFHNLLVSCFFAFSLCDVTSFSLKPGSQSLSGESVSLICTLDSYTNLISIFKSAEKTSDEAAAFSECSQTTCRNLKPGYTFTITGNTVEITVDRLQRAEDQKWWTCRTSISNSQRSEKQFYLTVYTLPSSITLKGPTKTCDLGQSKCEYTCTTDQCTYPSPSFTWRYELDDDTTKNVSHTTSITDRSDSCADSTKIYENKLTFPRYELYTGDTQKTVRLRCYITFTGLSSERLTSDVSQYVKFAEKVTSAEIFDGNTKLTGNTLTVNDKEEKRLKCIPGNGNPTPTVKWIIGNNNVSTASVFSFIPDNSHHGQQIYCVADNIPNNGLDDAESNKHTLFVNVKIQFVYIEPAADTVISVIEDTPEPVVCTTSAGRPGSMIKWYKNDDQLGEGDSTDFEITTNNLNVTKSTRYVKVLRSNSGWTLSCLASNIEDSTPIRANNSKQFNVLYPPEHMSLLFAGNPVVGPVVDVVKGIPGTLNCTASSNPSISLFSWNINQRVGNTLTIDDSIQHDQIVNCTARNTMTSTAGISRKGYGSISKKINLLYGAIIQRIEVNGIMDPPLIVKEKNRILIACYVDSNPKSTISLFRGGDLLKEKEQSAVLMHNISSAQCSHTGQYTCKAGNGITNVVQPTVKIVRINVECSPRLAAGSDTSVEAQENTTAVLSVTILAYPIPTEYDWHRNISNRWEKLMNSTSMQMIQASLQFNVTFISVKADDYGEYKLTVYNTNGDSFNFTSVLRAYGEPGPQTYKPDDGSTATAGIIGGVVGGLLLVCLIVVVVCILRRRDSLDDFKKKLFGRNSSASREDIQPQETGYSYAAVQKPTGGTALNIIDGANTETKLDGESTPATGYLYSEVNKSGRDNPLTIVKDKKALESAGGKKKTKKTKAAPETTNEGPCYENPTLLTESVPKAKPQKKGKPVKPKDKTQVPQSHDGLQYVELSFSDSTTKDKKGKKTKPAKAQADERTVYDAVQFGVVGAAYTSSGEENNSKN